MCRSWRSVAESSLLRNGLFVSAHSPRPCGEWASPAADAAPRRRRALVREMAPEIVCRRKPFVQSACSVRHKTGSVRPRMALLEKRRPARRAETGGRHHDCRYFEGANPSRECYQSAQNRADDIFHPHAESTTQDDQMGLDITMWQLF